MGGATVVMEKFKMAVCPVCYPPSHGEFQMAAEKGKAVTEFGAQGEEGRRRDRGALGLP